MSLNLKPLADRLVVEPKEREETTASGLILPETAKEKPQEGEIVSAGAHSLVKRPFGPSIGFSRGKSLSKARPFYPVAYGIR